MNRIVTNTVLNTYLKVSSEESRKATEDLRGGTMSVKFVAAMNETELCSSVMGFVEHAI